MALRRCLRTDFLLGFRHQIADALDCTGIELLGPSIGDQSPFDEALSHRRSDQSNQRPHDERASADRYASNEVAAVHYVVKQRLTLPGRLKDRVEFRSLARSASVIDGSL
jgi:hypothetical protein